MGTKAVKGLKFSYDAEADILYCSFGKPREAVSISAGERIYMRVDPWDPRSVVGFTIVGLRRLARKGRDFVVPLDAHKQSFPHDPSG